MIGSRVNGQPLVKFAPQSKVQQSFQGLVQTLTGQGPGGRSRPARGSGWFGECDPRRSPGTSAELR